jgi:DNA-binding SARP family transcriptional activator
MRFEILGPVRVHRDAAEVPITADRERTLLAMLLLHPNRTVPCAQLEEALWGGAPPQSARNQLQGCVSRLRKRLAGVAGPVIHTDPTGYRVEVGPEQLDLLEFRGLAAEARAAAAAGQRAQALERYRAALARWRGPAVAGVERCPVRHAAAALDEEHAQAQAERIDLELAAGAAGELVPELTDLARRHPHHEHLHRALMLALISHKMPSALSVCWDYIPASTSIHMRPPPLPTPALSKRAEHSTCSAAPTSPTPPLLAGTACMTCCAPTPVTSLLLKMAMSNAGRPWKGYLTTTSPLLRLPWTSCTPRSPTGSHRSLNPPPPFKSSPARTAPGPG